jgi:hypothetical protein
MSASPSRPSPRLAIHHPDRAPAAPLRCRINGWPASVHLWTDAEFARLDPPPCDAQPSCIGVWVAIRMD